MTAILLLAAVVTTNWKTNLDYRKHQLDRMDKMFTPFEYRFTGGRLVDELFRYRLFEPVADTPEKKYPLVVWLAGHGDLELNGPTNLGQLKWMKTVINSSRREDFPFFVLAMQCPKEKGIWYERSSLGVVDDPLAVYWEILQKIIRDYPVDPDRISIIGISSGGSAAWEMAMRHPDAFAAIAPLASGGGDVSRAKLLVNMSIWAFHCKYDSPEGDRRTVSAINHAGGTAWLTEDAKHSHNAWSAAILKHNLMTWLLAQDRTSDPTVPEPVARQRTILRRISSFKWQKYAAVPVAFGVILLALVMEGKRRRAAKNAAPPTEDLSDGNGPS